MHVLKPVGLCRIVLAISLSTCVYSNALAHMAGALPKPSECSATKTLTLPRGNHPKKYTAYGKIDLYCGSSTTPIVTGATFCNSDFPESKADTKTVTIEVSTKTSSGAIPSCKPGEDLTFKPE